MADTATAGQSLAAALQLVCRTESQFAQKAADIVGLYLNPPEKAVVISVDAFIAAYRTDAHPFEWTKHVVHLRQLKHMPAELLGTRMVC